MSAKKEGEEVVQVSEQRFSCSLWSRPWWDRLSPWSPWSSMVEQISTLQPMEDPTPEQVDAWRRLWPHGELTLEQASGRSCGPVERGAHGGADLLAGLVAPLETHSGAACSWRTTPCGKELFVKNRAHVGEVRGLYPMWGTPRWSTGRVWGFLPLRRQKQKRQCVMNWPKRPFPVPLRCFGGGSRENQE